jgi:hypothetical protein
MDLIKQLESLVKTLEAGSYNSAPGQLVQGSALQSEDLSAVMHNVCIASDEIKLQKLFGKKKAKSLTIQFNRQLSYGRLGGAAQREGAVGNTNVGDYVRATVPMCFYSEVRRVTEAANLIEAFDGIKAEDREAENAAEVIAMNIEFDLFKGKADFSNAGVFDGHPAAMPELPNMLGVDSQIRQSDMLVTTQDLMFASYGSNQSVVLAQNAALDQIVIEDARLRAKLNFSQAKNLYVDPVIMTSYNKKVALGTGTNSIQRIQLAGSAQDVSGASLRRQWTAHGDVNLEESHFLRGKTSPLRPNIGGPSAPAITTQPSFGGSGSLITAGTYVYLVTAQSEIGESPATATNTVSPTTGTVVTMTITAQSGVKFYSIYRGTNAKNAKFIGNVAATGGNVVFTDLGNKAPGFVTGYLLDEKTWEMHDLAAYSRKKLAQSDLSTPEAHYTFTTVAGYQPRKNVIIDNLI